MCFSATASYGAAAVLVATGLHACRLSRSRHASWRAFAIIPLLFGVQQGFEGRVWQMLNAGEEEGAIVYALGYIFFSHFFWLWWIPLASFLVESKRNRMRVYLALALFGGIAGGVIYIALAFNPHWLSITVVKGSIVYDISPPFHGPFSIGLPPSALYGVIVLVPLLFSSHGQVRVFGALVATSIAVASILYGYAFVSVWCFFAALISLYIVVMLLDRGCDRTQQT